MNRRLAVLALLAAALEALLLGLRRLAPWDQHVPEVVGLGLAAGLLYLAATHQVLRRSPAEGRAALILVLAAAILFRLTLIGVPPTLSDDLFRYRWEGRIQAAGWNPYLVTPQDPRLAELREPDFHRMPGAGVPAAYPPLAELYFHALAWVESSSTAPYQWGALALDLAVAGLLLLLLRARGEPPTRMLIYAWCPLVIIEFSGNGHYDALVLAGLLLANLCIIRGRAGASMAAEPRAALGSVLSGVGLAAASLAKWFPGLALPAFAVKGGWRWLAGFVGAALVLTWPYRDAGLRLVGGLEVYAEQWRNNESLFALLAWATERNDVAAGLALGVVAGLGLHAAQKRTEPLRACYWLVGAILLLAPSVFPWYVTWLVPFLCFYPNLAGLLLTVTVLLSYHVVIGYRALGVWQYEPGLVALEYLPVYALLLWRIVKRQGARPCPTQSLP